MGNVPCKVCTNEGEKSEMDMQKELESVMRTHRDEENSKLAMETNTPLRSEKDKITNTLPNINQLTLEKINAVRSGNNINNNINNNNMNNNYISHNHNNDKDIPSPNNNNSKHRKVESHEIRDIKIEIEEDDSDILEQIKKNNKNFIINSNKRDKKSQHSLEIISEKPNENSHYYSIAKHNNNNTNLSNNDISALNPLCIHLPGTIDSTSTFIPTNFNINNNYNVSYNPNKKSDAQELVEKLKDSVKNSNHNLHEVVISNKSIINKQRKDEEITQISKNVEDKGTKAHSYLPSSIIQSDSVSIGQSHSKNPSKNASRVHSKNPSLASYSSGTNNLISNIAGSNMSLFSKENGKHLVNHVENKLISSIIPESKLKNATKGILINNH